MLSCSGSDWDCLTSSKNRVNSGSELRQLTNPKYETPSDLIQLKGPTLNPDLQAAR